MIIYLLIGTILIAMLLGLNNTNPVGERLIDRVGGKVVLYMVVGIIAWPLIIVAVIKEFTK